MKARCRLSRNIVKKWTNPVEAFDTTSKSVTKLDNGNEIHYVRNGMTGGYFAFFGYSEELNAVWGYAELVNDEEYYDKLSNLEALALEIFEARRQEIDGAA